MWLINPQPVTPTPSVNVAENSGTANDGTVCVGTSVTLTASGGSTYAWSNGIINGVAFTPCL